MSLPTDDLLHVLLRTGDTWEALRGRRLFLTGATGFFGRWLLETFLTAHDALDLGAKTVVLTRNPDRFAEKAPTLASRPEITFVRGDVADFSFPPGEFSHVIHAATTSGGPVPENEQRRTIIDGTARVLEFAEQCGARRLLFTSSGAVYGRQPPDLAHLPEDYSCPEECVADLPIYGAGKRAAEQLCLSAASDRLGISLARCFAFVGPHLPLDAHFAIGNFIRDALRGSAIRVQGDGTPLRSYLYAADLAVWLWTLLFKGPSGRVYNVGSAEAISIRDLAETIGRSFGLPVSVAGQPVPGAPPARYVPDTRRARLELGLEEWIALEEGIRRTARWARGGG